MSGERDVRVTCVVRGQVQGVGFRWWTRDRALELGLAGSARNATDGRVEVVAQGPADRVHALVRLLSEQPSSAGRPGRVASCDATEEPPGELSGFSTR